MQSITIVDERKAVLIETATELMERMS